MKRTLPVFAALALGLAVPASAQEESAPPPPPPAEPAAAVEEPAPPPAEAAEPGAPRRERPRRPGFGPRRDGPEGAAGPRRDGPGGAGRLGPGGAPGMHEGGSIGFLVPLLQRPEAAARIGLPEERAQALAATFAELDAQLKAVNGKLPDAFRRQADALEAEKPDEAAVLAAVNEVWDLRREVALLQTRKVLAIRTSLTAEQIEKARALLREERRARRGEGDRGDDGMRRGPGERGPGERRGAPGEPGGRRGPKPGFGRAEGGAEALAPGDEAR
jgi:Spy/CpxP family protein refolding chaperone